MYIVIITDQKDFFLAKKVYGTFESVEEIQKWLKEGNKFNNSSYSIDIYPVKNPNE